MTRKLNLQRLKNKVAQLNGERPATTRKSVFWSPQLPKGEASHEYMVYLLPFPDQDDYPFKERWFYYALGNMKGPDGKSLKDKNGRYINAPLTLKQFGEADPVDELIRKLWDEEGKEEEEAKQDREDAKKLFASQTAYVPVIVKGEESLGVRLWKFSSKNVYERLIELFVKHETYGVLNDPENARWLTVKLVEVPKKKAPMNKKISAIDPEFANEPLSEDSEQIAKWLKEVPDLDDALKFQRHDYDGLKELLVMWSESGQDDDKIAEEGTEGAKVEATEDSEKKAPKKRGRPKKKKEEPQNKEEALQELNDKFFDDDDDDE